MTNVSAPSRATEPTTQNTTQEGPAMTGTPSAQISRRTVAKGIAWSAPAVAMMGVAPAFAASPDSCRTAYLDWGGASTTKLANGTVYTIRGTDTVYARVTYTETAGSFTGTNTLDQRHNTGDYQLRVGKTAYGWVRNASGDGRVNYWDISTTGGANDLILNQKAGSGATTVTIDFFRDAALTQPVYVHSLEVPLDDLSTQETFYNSSRRDGLSYQEMWSVTGTTASGSVTPRALRLERGYNLTSTLRNISGSGTQSNPWHFSLDLTNSLMNQVGGNLITQFQQSVSSVTVTYGSSCTITA